MRGGGAGKDSAGRVVLGTILVVVLGATTILGGCKSTTTAPKIPGIYPLTTGSIWQYTDGKADTVVGKTMIDGKSYAIIHGDLLGPIYARFLSNGEFWVRLDVTDPHEALLFDLSATPQDSWDFTLPADVPAATVTLTSDNDVVNAPAGTFTGCYSFYFDVPKTTDVDITYVVSPDTGLVYLLQHDGSAYSLVSFTPGSG